MAVEKKGCKTTSRSKVGAKKIKATAKAKTKAKTKIKTKAKAKTTARSGVKARAKAKTKTTAKIKVKTTAKAGVKTTATRKVKSKATTKTTSSTTVSAKKGVVKPKRKATVKTVNKSVKKKLDTKKNSGIVGGSASRAVRQGVMATMIKKEEHVRQRPKKQTNKGTMRGGAADSLGFSSYDGGVDEEYMSDSQVEHFHQILLAWRQNLLEEMDSTVVHLKEDVEALADPLDRAAQEEGFRLELRTRDRERKLIKKIEKSLADIKSGDYGFCKDCGIEIGVNRLEARPTAVRCIDCKTIQEIKEKQGSG